MNLSTIEALAIAWARIAEEAELPAGYEGTATPEAHRACEVIQERIREHVVATNDMRLFGLLHLLGQASLRMRDATSVWEERFESHSSSYCCYIDLHRIAVVQISGRLPAPLVKKLKIN